MISVDVILYHIIGFLSTYSYALENCAFILFSPTLRRFILNIVKERKRMIIVQETFVCKPGFASKMAKAMKESFEGEPEFVRVMTDMTGEFNRVIIVTQYEDYAAYQKSWEKWMNPTPEMKEKMSKMPNHTEMYLTGKREILKVW